ncbi:HupE/UreJ family protein [Chromobacterium rhizoryzae]|uniref:HupE/UreJ family protein n=1 Tax=Chromobacterium rhizoryzae TaxID=1778675 RepID=UPI001D083CB7|nr:HupE/UreJ family protein [Chromobacterium rhizoryzae]
MTFLRKFTPAALALLLASGLAQAHPGHAVAGFSSGLEHPLGGLDHLLAMLAVGLWSWRLGGAARWQGPLTFMAMLAAGGVLGWLGVSVAALESGIAASVIALGLLLAFALQPRRGLALAAIAGFALLHGVAHGQEMPHDASGLAYAAGFVLASGLLHAAGLLLGRTETRLALGERLGRVAGGGIAACGVLMLGGWV